VNQAVKSEEKVKNKVCSLRQSTSIALRGEEGKEVLVAYL